MKIALVLLAAAVCFSIAVGDNLNLKLDPKLLKKSPLSGILLQARTNHRLEGRSLQPRQIGTAGCSSQMRTTLVSAIPEDCISNLNITTGSFLLDFFFINDLFRVNPATLTAALNVVCQPRCGNPIAQLYRDCGNPVAQTIRYLCSTNAVGSRCYERFDPLFANADQSLFGCSSSTVSCSPTCSSALTTLRSNTGCCVNFLNDSAVFGGSLILQTLEFELWDRCNVSTPTFCDLDTSTIGGATTVIMSKIVTVGLLLAAYVLLN